MASVDIAIPCYQYGRFLEPCVASVLSQGVAELRILIIDNASTDDTAAVARRLQAMDPRVHLRSHAVNLGPHASFNAGVDWARADYFMILCADDLLAPGALRRAIAVLEAHPGIGFAYGADLQFRAAETLPPAASPAAAESWRLMSGAAFVDSRCRAPDAYIAAGMVLVRTAIQRRAGHYRPELPYTDDLEMLLRLASLAGAAETTAVQGYRRLHGANMSEKFLGSRAEDMAHRLAAFDSFFAREGRTMPAAPALRRRAHRMLAARAYWWAVQDVLGGRVGDAAVLLRHAARLQPSLLLWPPLLYLLRGNGRLARGASAMLRACAGPLRRTGAPRGGGPAPGGAPGASSW